jgi:hypothetical protein
VAMDSVDYQTAADPDPRSELAVNFFRKQPDPVSGGSRRGQLVQTATPIECRVVDGLVRLRSAADLLVEIRCTTRLTMSRTSQSASWI